MLTSEILDKAADVIEHNGWTQGNWYVSLSDREPEECPVCAAGAINVGADHVPDVDEAYGSLREAIEAFARRVDPGIGEQLDEYETDPDDWREPDIYDAIGRWNDARERTAEQVVAELRAAAASEREAGR